MSVASSSFTSTSTESGGVISVNFDYELSFSSGGYDCTSYQVSNNGSHPTQMPTLTLNVEGNSGAGTLLTGTVPITVTSTNTGNCLDIHIEVKEGGGVIHTETHEVDSDDGCTRPDPTSNPFGPEI